jgi:hypothetical protein
MISDEMVAKAGKAWTAAFDQTLSTEEAVRAAIEAVAPAIMAAGKSEGLEEAAMVADGVRDRSRREIRSALDATEIAASIRALIPAPPQPAG